MSRILSARPPRSVLTVVSLCALLLAPLTASAGLFDRIKDRLPGQELKNAIFVGNNWDGTIDVIDGDNYEPIGRINGIPDYEERMREIRRRPKDFAVFLGIRQLIGEGNDQYVDDM